MTKLETFVAFARDLPEDRLAALEQMLDDLMRQIAGEDELTPEELADIEWRLANDHETADQAEVEAILGRKFS
jgi:hypothetical protein